MSTVASLRVKVSNPMVAKERSLIRVCVVVSGHPSVVMGGAQYQAHLLAEEFARRDGVAITYLGRGMPQGEKAANMSYKVRKIGDASGIRSRALFFDSFALWQSLSEIQPHVIYQRMKQSYTGVCARYARKHNIPMFFHVASAADVSQKLIGKRLSLNLAFDVVETSLGNWGLKNASDLIVQTQSQAGMLKANFGRVPTHLVNNFQPLPNRLPMKDGVKLKILWVGNFKDIKRPELFVKLARSLVNRKDIEFWMVGLTAKQRRFEGVMADIANSSNLRYFGPLPLSEVNSLMAQAHVLVNTSVSEGFSNTFIQAWSNGAIVVSLGVDVDNGLESQGIGFCTKGLEQMKSVLVDLAQSPYKRTAIAARAFEHVHRFHSFENGVHLVDSILAAASRSVDFDARSPDAS